MKVIDEKGKLFGKINVIDLLVLILLVAMAGAIAWRVLGARALTAQKNEQIAAAEAEKAYENAPHLRYTVVCNDILPEIAEYYVEERPFQRNQLVSNATMQQAYIIDCTDEADPDHEGKRVVTFTIEAAISVVTKVKETDPDIYFVGTQELRIGYTHIVKTCEMQATGLITSLEVLDA